VAVSFESVSPAVTRVRLRHLGFIEQAAAHPDHATEFEQARVYFTGAWPKVLGALSSHFAPAAK
jgi:hypothetical protein